MEVILRKAKISDFEQIHDLCENDLGYKCNKEYLKIRLSNLIYNRECVFVAVLNDKVVGFIHIEKYETLFMPQMVNILGIAVKNKFRRQGIGQKLLTVAEDWAKNNGINKMRLNSGESRKEAHIFYRSMGYNDDKKQLRFLKTII